MKGVLEVSPEAGGSWPKLNLTKDQKEPWEFTRAAALWALPHITDVWYAMMIDKDGAQAWFTDKVKTAATDDKYMYLNPTFYFKHKLEERVFIAAHEVMHAIMNHCGLMFRLSKLKKVTYPDGDVLPFSQKLLNIAADCVINAILVDSKVGGMPEKCWYLPQIISGDMSALDAYRILYKRWKFKGPGPKPPKGEGRKPGEDDFIFEVPDGEKGESFDEHLEPGEGRGVSPEQAESERNPQEWEDAVNSALESARQAGRLPANIERIFKLSTEVPTNWQDEIAIQVTQSIGREGHSWSFLDGEFALRGIGFPARVRYGCKLVAVFVDSSGSINAPTMNMFMTNIAAIISQVKPKELIFGECDAEIHRWEIITDIADLNCKVLGGGGTSIRPPFKRIDDEALNPDVVIYFTDLDIYDGFPDAPSYSVIWACTEKNKQAPFGKTIYVPPLKSNPEVYND